jgi:hypothetical protein
LKKIASILVCAFLACKCLAPPPGGLGGGQFNGGVNSNFQGGSAPAGSGSFLPSDVSGLFGWWKADNLVTNTAGTTPPADSDTIHGWGDSSGNNRTLTPASNDPTWRNAATTGRTIGGIQFSATTRLRVGFTALTSSTIFVLWRNASSGATHMAIDSTNTANRMAVYINGADAFSIYSGAAFVTTGVAANPSYNAQTAIFVAAGNDTIRTNGVVAISSSDSGSDTLDGLTVGGAWDGANNLGTGEYVSEVIVYNRATLSGTELANVEAYLLNR